jgi:hypothetical protein
VREVPLRRTLSRLWQSDVWHLNTAMVIGKEPVDVWRQGCWRFLRSPGQRGGRSLDIVLGVPIDGRRSVVRAAITDAETGARLAVLGEIAMGIRQFRPMDGASSNGTGVSTVRAYRSGAV